MENEACYELDKCESEAFKSLLREMRKKHISSAREIFLKSVSECESNISQYLSKKDISKVIFEVRELAFKHYLKEESRFNTLVLENISKNFQIPKASINKFSHGLFNLEAVNQEVFCNRLIEEFGICIGKITPYLYGLFLSNTQSRRARAGSTFEEIVYYLYERFRYRFDAQKIVKQKFAKSNLGKIVDSILPGVEEFDKYRQKVVVGTMKTTLRERWQEVIEESERSKIPHIHLQTIDSDIPRDKIRHITQHNITLVVLNEVKRQKYLKDEHSVINFEQYFFDEIPLVLKYWGGFP